MTGVRVVGIDIWKGRWLAVILQDGRFTEARVADRIQNIVDDLADAAVIAIDVPIGLPTVGAVRAADTEARKFIGARRSSVFSAPARELLDEPTVQAANALARQSAAAGVSAQAFALRSAILEVEPLAAADRRVYEVHPEVSFCEAAGGVPLPHSKTSWNGQNQRQQLLQGHEVVLPADIASIRDGGAMDVIDAAICAWSAHRIAIREAVRRPAGRERAPAIWA
jgi:predicted RNase H-like nuclease